MLPRAMEHEPEEPGAPVELSTEETTVMLGHFAGASFPELAQTTGLPVPRLRAIVSRLARLGLIDAEAASALPAEVAEVEDPPTAGDDLVALLDFAVDGLTPAVAAAPPALLRETERRPAEPARVEAPCIEEAPPADADVTADTEPDAAPAEDEPAALFEQTREYQKLFETELHPLPGDQRVALAGTATGARLFALCFDPEPRVIVALLANAAVTLEHARLVAFHHRTAHGLEELARRSSVASDPLVHRRLVRNPALDEAMFRRLMGSKRLLAVHKVAQDRDVPERTRAAARALFRTKFATAQAEERVEIVWATEGRILSAMAGLTFDSRTTSILCTKTYASVILIQSLARFPATPPPLIAHLLRQPLVKRQVHLKNQLLQHPNTPSEAKRRL